MQNRDGRKRSVVKAIRRLLKNPKKPLPLVTAQNRYGVFTVLTEP